MPKGSLHARHHDADRVRRGSPAERGRLPPNRRGRTIGLPTLLQLVPSPKHQEDKRVLKHVSGTTRRHAEVRALVQRMLKSTQKGKNVDRYARYIAAGIKGELGRGWSTPPITLWLAGEPGAVSEELVPNTGICTITLTAGSPVVAIDGETQVTALHELSDDPERYDLTAGDLNTVRLPFELYWGISVEDARQIFYDRNVEGVPVAKNLAMSMDQRDFGTHLAHRVADAVKVEHEGRIVSLSKLVESRKRQLGKSDPEVVTLSALRVLVTATVFGRNGIALSSATVREDDLPEHLPDEVTPGQVERETVNLLGDLLTHLFPYFAARSAISAPAVLAGLGVAAHQATTWSDGELTRDGLTALLADVRWEREARYWENVAARSGASGSLNFGGGAKDAGGRVADALLSPGSPSGRQIRGLQ